MGRWERTPQLQIGPPPPPSCCRFISQEVLTSVLGSSRLWGPDADAVILTLSRVPAKSSLPGSGGGWNTCLSPRLSPCQVSPSHQRPGTGRDSGAEAQGWGAETWPRPRRGSESGAPGSLVFRALRSLRGNSEDSSRRATHALSTRSHSSGIVVPS